MMNLNKQYRLFAALMLFSSAALAAQQTAQACKAVNDAAHNSMARIQARIDAAQAATSQAVAGAKSCVDQVLEQANRSVPDFGGGTVGSLSQYASAALAKQGCQLIASAQTQAMSQVPSQAQPVIRDAAATLGSQGNGAQSQSAPDAAQPSVWQRLANVF